MKQFGSQIKSGIGKTSSNIKTGKPLLSGTFMGKGGGKIKKAADVKFKKRSTPKSIASDAKYYRSDIDIKKAHVIDGLWCFSLVGTARFELATP